MSPDVTPTGGHPIDENFPTAGRPEQPIRGLAPGFGQGPGYDQGPSFGQAPGYDQGPSTGWGPAAPVTTSRRPRRALRTVTIIVLVVAGLAGAGFGIFAIARELTRPPTAAELAAASKAEIARRWRQFPAGQVFPATVSYQMQADTVTEQARLTGIAPQTECGAAGGVVASVLSKRHCTTLLRATYADASGTLLATVGVAVMPDAAAALAVTDDLAGTTQGIRPVGFAGTVSQGFAAASALNAHANAAGPYVVLDVSGFADGRRAGVTDLSANPLYFADEVAATVMTGLTRKIGPCTAVDIQC
jgi:hypothetical protein